MLAGFPRSSLFLKLELIHAQNGPIVPIDPFYTNFPRGKPRLQEAHCFCNTYNPLAQLVMFLLVICSTIMGASHQMSDFILNIVQLLLAWACKGTKMHSNARQFSILDQLPSTVETILAKFDFNGMTTMFTACPMCHCIYPPTFLPGSTILQYPTTCKNYSHPDSNPCSSLLLKDSILDDRIWLSKPLKPYIVANLHDYLANLLSQKDL